MWQNNGLKTVRWPGTCPAERQRKQSERKDSGAERWAWLTSSALKYCTFTYTCAIYTHMARTNRTNSKMQYNKHGMHFEYGWVCVFVCVRDCRIYHIISCPAHQQSTAHFPPSPCPFPPCCPATSAVEQNAQFGHHLPSTERERCLKRFNEKLKKKLKKIN